MSFKTFSDKDCQHSAYDLKYCPLSFGDAPVHGMLCRVEPSSRSAVHNHVEPEYFYFLSGHGVVHLDQQSVELRAGEGIQVSAFVNHVVENKSATEPLQFLSFYWEKTVTEAEKQRLSAPRTLIFSTPPTPNGDLHLGHLSGPYLAADIYRRFLHASGNQAYHVTGRDDHQSYVMSKAQIDGRSPRDIADTYADCMQKTLTNYQIDLNYFIEPNSDGAYAAFVHRLFLKLYDAGFIIEKEEPAAFSADDQCYLHEAFIRGRCPFCHRESDGNACEECGRPNDCVSLTQSYARVSKQNVAIGSCKRLYFKMSLLAESLEEYVKSTPMSAHALTLSQAMITDGLPDICVSHVGEWGIPIPVKGFEQQRLYVWFEMAFGYLWAALQLAPAAIEDEWEKIQWSYRQAEAQVVHFYGFDNTFYHTLLFPAVYFALGGLTPPGAHIINELLDLDGSKFSTSRGHLIWGRDFLKTAPLDSIRWFLCEVRPEGMRSNFKLADFSSNVNSLFSETLQCWVMELGASITTEFNGMVPEPGAWSDEQRHFYNMILSLRHQVLDAYHAHYFSPRTITALLRNIAVTSHRFQQTQLLYLDKRTVSNYLRTALALSCWALKLFALLAKPITPTYSLHLLTWLTIPVEQAFTDTAFVSSGTVLDSMQMPTWPVLLEDRILESLPAGVVADAMVCS